MTCFFIDPGERQIFANLIEPRRNTADAVVVLFYPFGQEYMRAHRAYRQLATMLARAGFYVMRFDYPGSGDSYGDIPLSSFKELLTAADRVIEEAKRKTGKNQVYLCGLRFGSLVAMETLANRKDITGVFLWDAYLSGEAFINACENEITARYESEEWLVHGFPLSKSIRCDIQKLNIASDKYSGIQNFHHFISGESDASNALQAYYETSLETHLVPSNGDWNYVDLEGTLLMPSELVRALSKVIASASRGSKP